MFARRTAARLVEPLLQAMVIEDLLTIIALHVLFLHNVEADGAEEGVDKLLIRLHSVLFRHLVVFSELKDVRLSDFFNVCYELFCLPLHVFLEPGADPEGALVVHGHHSIIILRSRNHCKF